MTNHEIQFQPDGLRITVTAGTLLTDAMKKAGIAVNLPCAGTGKCGKCAVEIRPEAPEPNEYDRLHLSPEKLDTGIRLACKTKVEQAMTVLIPDSMRALGGQILLDGLDRPFELASSVLKRYVELPEPSLEDQAADLYRIKRALDGDSADCPDFDIDLARNMPSILRDSGYKVTVVSHNERVIAVEPGDTVSCRYGMAFDIGTTTVVGTLIYLTSGHEISRASRLNEQVIFGEDTISRIQHAISTENGREELRGKILGVINDIISEAAEKAGVDDGNIYEAVFAGNTTMSHLFLGLDVEGLSKIPFVPVISAAVNIRAGDAGVGIHPQGNCHVIPNIAGFVGSDTVSVMLACDFLIPGRTQLAVDVGTNGELALLKDDELMVCSTAAGPALEGAALHSGMRAAAGAIEHVRIGDDGDIEIDVIGDVPAVGVCGSGIIDLVAVLLDAGIIDEYGTMLSQEHLEGEVSGLLLDRIISLDDQPAFLVSGDRDVSDTKAVIITQKDVRQIQMGKGAINAGIVLLLKQKGLTPEDLDDLLLAGAFGNYIDRWSAVRIGLLPQIGLDKIKFVGNAASTGAKMTLLSRKARSDADTIRHKTDHLELASLPEFMIALSDSMLFPAKGC